MLGRTSPLLSGHHCTVKGGVWSQVSRAEALRVGPKLVLFPLNVCFSLSLYQDPYLRGAECWSKRGPCRLLAHVSSRLRLDILPVQVLMAPFRCSLRCKSPLSLRANHCPQPLLPLAFCGTAPQGRQGPCRLLAYIRGWAVVEQLPSEIWAPAEALLV